MRITVSGVTTPCTDNQRGYVEYRIFTSIAPHERLVRSVNVVVRRDLAEGRQFLCSVIVDLGASGRIKTQARGPHFTAAIDRAADRTAWLVGRRVEPDFSVNAAGFSS